MYKSFIDHFRKPYRWQTHSSLTSQLHSFPSSGPEALFDATVAHGLSSANSSPRDLEGSPLVGGYALVISAQIRLNLLPHFLLGVQLFIRLTCIRQQREKHVSSAGRCAVLKAWIRSALKSFKACKESHFSFLIWLQRQHGQPKAENLQSVSSLVARFSADTSFQEL